MLHTHIRLDAVQSRVRDGSWGPSGRRWLMWCHYIGISGGMHSTKRHPVSPPRRHNLSSADVEQWRSWAHVQSLRSQSSGAARRTMGSHRRDTVTLCARVGVTDVYESPRLCQGYIWPRERVALCATRHRLTPADKWIRSCPPCVSRPVLMGQNGLLCVPPCWVDLLGRAST